jgi:hypothetical protein
MRTPRIWYYAADTKCVATFCWIDRDNANVGLPSYGGEPGYPGNWETMALRMEIDMAVIPTATVQH